MKPLLLIVAWTLLNFQPLNAKVEAPNYNFSVSTLNDFYPGAKLAELDKKYGKAEEVSRRGEVRTLKYQVAHLRYKFPVLVQVKGEEVHDMFARLPSYFLHDVFHQSLINRLGKQDDYKRVGEEAVYVWKNKDGKRHVYQGSCTITCFPVYYAVEPVPPALEGLQAQMRSRK
jgi:hypothetical protein